VSLPVVLRPTARQEYDDAVDYYESQRAGLGARFGAHVNEVLTRIGQSPKMHGVVRDNVRKAVVRKFPYCIYYRELADRVEVISVFHTSRDPADWQSRIHEDGDEDSN
jgi:toxin ParE1/3/4